MATRFTDNVFQSAEDSDFIVRKWKGTALQFLVLFTITFLAIYLASVIMYDLGRKDFFLIVLAGIIGALGWFTSTLAARNRDLVMATEFQNAMLASAAQLSTRFCFICRRDGTIVYIDPGFQSLFQPFMHSGSVTIDGLLTYAGTDNETRQRIIGDLTESKNDRILLAFKDTAGSPISLMVTIDMLPRPKGYFLFRGRDYVEKRSSRSATEAITTNTAILLEHVISSLPEGVLVANADKIITYANRTLESWLGYEPGELLATSRTLGEVCCRYADTTATEPLFDNFEGDVTLQRKNGEQITLKTRQTLVHRDDQVIGLNAIISTPITPKKKKAG